MRGVCFVIYVQAPDGSGGHYPEVLSSVADSERLAKVICDYKNHQDFIARYQPELVWNDEISFEFWEKQLCDIQQS